MQDDTQTAGATRTCAWRECPNPLSSSHGNARYCSNRCKSAAYKDRTGYRVVGVRDRPQTRKPETRQRHGGQRGLAPAWRKVIDTAVARFGIDEEEAVRTFAPTLSDKQREQLANRADPERTAAR